APSPTRPRATISAALKISAPRTAPIAATSAGWRRPDGRTAAGVEVGGGSGRPRDSAAGIAAGTPSPRPRGRVSVGVPGRGIRKTLVDITADGFSVTGVENAMA